MPPYPLTERTSFQPGEAAWGKVQRPADFPKNAVGDGGNVLIAQNIF